MRLDEVDGVVVVVVIVKTRETDVVERTVSLTVLMTYFQINRN